MSTKSIWTPLLLQLLLIILNAIFASAEIAVLSINKNKLEKYAADGHKKALKLTTLTSKPEKFLATIQVGITLAGYLGAAFAGNNFSHYLTDWFLKIGLNLPETTLNHLAVIIITLILSFFTLVFGELVPKRVAMRHAEKIGFAFTSLLVFISIVFKPLVWLLTKATTLILIMLKIDPKADDSAVTEEEIRLLIDVGSAKGTIEVEEREMIENIFEFDDTIVAEIMTHRLDVELLWTEDSLKSWDKIIDESFHTQYPICTDSPDNIVGILNTKYYFRLKDKSLENIMKHAVKPAYFVPETATINVLFSNMQKTQNHFAVVLDEYGGMSGIITINDVLAEIVGEFDDNLTGKKKPPQIKKLSDGSWLIQGTAPLDEVAEQLDVTLPEDEFETFAGYLLNLLGTIPDDGEKPVLDTEDLHIQILQILDHRIVSTKVAIIEKIITEE